MDRVVEKYFDCIEEEPKDGDLAIYKTMRESKAPGLYSHIPLGTTTHAGTFRASKPNWNSPRGGTIESKWGWFSNPYVFQHDVFFAPDFYGDEVKFYQLRK